jgi:hypothetical protein
MALSRCPHRRINRCAARSDISGFLLTDINRYIRNCVLQDITNWPPSAAPSQKDLTDRVRVPCLINAIVRMAVPAWMMSPCCSTGSLLVLQFVAVPAQDAQSRSGKSNRGSAPDRLCKGESSASNPTTTSTTTQTWEKAKHAPLARDIVGLADTYPLKHLAGAFTSQGLSE